MERCKMDTIELYRELNTFYQIRGDEYARNYLCSFINMVLEEKIPVSEFMSFFEKNKNKIGNYGKTTESCYQPVLKQFIKYVSLVDGISTRKPKSQKTKKTKIYDDFHTFQNHNKYY